MTNTREQDKTSSELCPACTHSKHWNNCACGCDLHKTLQDALEVLLWSDAEQRQKFFIALRDKFCLSCGDSEGRHPCQCENDE